MLINSRYILFSINVLVLLLSLIIIFMPDTVLRSILGLPAVVFLPGYTLLIAVFPRKTSINGIQRFALSLGLSIVIIVFAGLVLNYTPWGLQWYTVLISLASFVFLISLIAWFRVWKIAPGEDISLHIGFKSLKFSVLFPFKSTRDIIISVLLLIAMVGFVGILVHVVNQPRNGENFTEFYLLDSGTVNTEYPRVVTLDESFGVTLVVNNHENRIMEYRIEITLDNKIIEEISPINLSPGEKWQREISITPTSLTPEQEVTFNLYRSTEKNPTNFLRLLIEVTY